ncbi:MAG: hypothetical protein WBF68_09250 [Atribacterota bacterium]
MKKLIYLIVLALILGLVLTGCLLSNVGQVPTSEQSGISYLMKHTEEIPFVTDLIAGGGNPKSAIDVGDVLVWNDEDNLYVKYVITEGGWCLTETHLHVATTLEGIPQKNGNPPPGKFEYSTEHDPWPTEYIYEVDLGAWTSETLLYIAAHAVVVHVVEDECISVISDAGVKWLDLDGITWYNAVPSHVHSSWPAFPGAIWIWRTEHTDVVYEYDNVPQYATDPKYGWLFKKQVTLPDTAFDILGSIDINADNSYEFFLDGVFVDGEGTMHRDGPDGYEWETIKNYSLAVNPGSNELSFRVLNYFRTGTSTGNPAGLIFKADVCYDYIDQEETAWGSGEDFPGKNWATYFTYTVQEMPVVTPGYSGLTEAAGVRYKGDSTGNEIYLGLADLGVGNRVELSYPDVNNSWPDGTYTVTFAFDQAENKITTSIDGSEGLKSAEYDFDDLGHTPSCATTDWNTLDILVVDRLTTGAIAFNNVMLDSFPLGSFGTYDVSGAPGWSNWTVTGFDFSQSFTITGELMVEGWTGNELNKMQIIVGCLP